MKKLLRYRYDTETNYPVIILYAIVFTLLWITLIISQYPYYMEKFSFKAWLCERVGMGIFAAVFWLITLLFMTLDKDRKHRKEIIQHGRCYDGEIVGYITKRHTYYHHGKESLRHPKTYLLCVKCRGETIVTPELHGNPERILKSTKCRVYDYHHEKYVTDFQERFFRIGKGISIPQAKTEHFR